MQLSDDLIGVIRPTSVIWDTLAEHKKLVLVGGGVLASGIFLWKKHNDVAAWFGIGPYPAAESNRLFRGVQRSLINYTKKDLSMKMFPLNALQDQLQRRVNDNGHPVSGNVRDAARQLITSTIDSIGYKMHEISPARQSEFVDSIVHHHYAVGDLQRDWIVDEPEPDSVIVGIDIDYYVEDFDKLLGYGLPMLLHLFNPRNVAGFDGDSIFRIDNDEVIYDVSGGSSWKHKVWNWCAYGEFVKSKACNWSWCNIFGVTKKITHKICYSRPWNDCKNRVLVWCIPVNSYWSIDWIREDLNVRQLERVRYADKNGWNRIVFQGEAELLTNFGRKGEEATVTIPKEHFDVLMGLTSAQSVSSRLISMGYKNVADLALISQYFGSVIREQNSVPRLGRSIVPKVHWPAAMEADAPEVSSRVYARPLVSDHNLMPMIRRWEVLSVSLDRRVEFVKNSIVPNMRYQHFANEFVRLVVPHQGVGVPYGLEDTVAMLDKPSQALAIKQIWETVDVKHRKLIEAFHKNEPTMKPGRIISSFADVRFLLHLSKFTLNFRDEILHSEDNEHWFCPGGTPAQIATKVVDYVRMIDEPIEGDFSNFDGTVSAWCQRYVMNAVYHRYFNERYREELMSYTDMLISCPARAKAFGFKYDAGCGVKSGAPTTCDANTVLNAFIQYAAIRLTLPELKPDEAFRTIGLAFGDDSIFERRFQKRFVKVATDLGMKLKVERFDHSKGLTFLARVFPDPYKTNTTFQDPLRTWRKLHITTRDPNVPLGTAATDRVEGYMVTDRYSPVTNEFCEMIKRSYAGDVAEDKRRDERKSRDKEKPYWLTAGGAWPQDPEDIGLMFEITANRTGVEVEKLRELCEQLKQINDPWSDFTINRDDEPTSWSDTIDEDGCPVDGDVGDRIFTNDMRKIHIRASGGITIKDSPGFRRPDGITPQRRERCADRQGSEGVPHIPKRDERQNTSRDKEPAGKTPVSEAPKRRKHRRGKGQPTQPENKVRKVGFRNDKACHSNERRNGENNAKSIDGNRSGP
nr:MAG: RNA-dependent RNA polymerase [Sichuan forest noda-like virus 2]